jgi:antitoxin HigA-1
MSRQGKLVPPVSPGEALREDIDVTQEELAKAMRVSRFTVNQIINGKRGVTAEMALRIARVTSTSPEYWLNLQRDVDLYEARRKHGKEIAKLRVVRAPKSARELFVIES